MKKWALSDLKEFGYLRDGSQINLHGTTYVCHNVNRWADSVMLEDIGLQPEPELPTYLDKDKVYNLLCKDGYLYENTPGIEILHFYPTEEAFKEDILSYSEV